MGGEAERGSISWDTGGEKVFTKTAERVRIKWKEGEQSDDWRMKSWDAGKKQGSDWETDANNDAAVVKVQVSCWSERMCFWEIQSKQQRVNSELLIMFLRFHFTFSVSVTWFLGHTLPPFAVGLVHLWLWAYQDTSYFNTFHLIGQRQTSRPSTAQFAPRALLMFKKAKNLALRHDL